ncbi:MAG: VanZ family protein [Anaerostipes hadrus]|jgi:VanZ family protein
MMHAEAVHTFVRKTAHFTEYAVLGFFTYKAVSCDVLDRKKAVLTAQLISTGYASTDEIHQMFVPGREGKVFDVMIDSCGAFCGIMVSLITQKLIEKKKGNQI